LNKAYENDLLEETCLVVIKLFEDEVTRMLNQNFRQLIRLFGESSNLAKGNIIDLYSTKKVHFSKEPIIDTHYGTYRVHILRDAKWKDIKNNEREAHLGGFETAAEMRQFLEKRYGSKLQDDTEIRIIRYKW